MPNSIDAPTIEGQNDDENSSLSAIEKAKLRIGGGLSYWFEPGHKLIAAPLRDMHASYIKGAIRKLVKTMDQPFESHGTEIENYLLYPIQGLAEILARDDIDPELIAQLADYIRDFIDKGSQAENAGTRMNTSYLLNLAEGLRDFPERNREEFIALCRAFELLDIDLVYCSGFFDQIRFLEDTFETRQKFQDLEGAEWFTSFYDTIRSRFIDQVHNRNADEVGFTVRQFLSSALPGGISETLYNSLDYETKRKLHEICKTYLQTAWGPPDKISYEELVEKGAIPRLEPQETAA